ncbi:MAG TPA: nucleoside hydrolase-like domain-containing protein, partial [Mucilaginibacter sp.]
LFYVVSPGGYSKATWLGINGFVAGINNETISNAWIAAHIQQNHGPLGALYPDVAYGMEGDTPSWLGLVPNGLSNPEHPDWGGWGGRYELYTPKLADLDVNGFTGGVPVETEPRPIWTNAADTYKPVVYNAYGRAVKTDSNSFTNNKVTIWRWRDDFQNDFAARIDWTIKPYKDANHPPVPALAHPDTITVKSGAFFTLDATGTTDPDGDSLSYLWFQYPEASTYKKHIETPLAENLYRISLKAPVVEKKETVHFILRVTDKGKPPLSRYKRVIVTIIP